MDAIFFVLSTLGSVVSLIMFLVEIFKERKLTSICLVIFSLLCTGVAGYAYSEIQQMKNTYKAAHIIIDGNKNGKIDNKGFVLAGISFLEVNKNVFPESYNNVINIKENMYTEIKKGHYLIAPSSAADEIRGILYGISALYTK